MPDITAEPYDDESLAKLVELAKRRGIGYVEKRLIATIQKVKQDLYEMSLAENRQEQRVMELEEILQDIYDERETARWLGE